MITRMDRDIGSLADLLRTRGIDRKTLVMFVSDNGPHQEGGGDPVFFKSSGGCAASSATSTKAASACR